MPFTGHPSLDRTSPEGRSYEDVDLDSELSPKGKSMSDGTCQVQEEQLKCNNLSERGMEDIASISSYFNFLTPTSSPTAEGAVENNQEFWKQIGEETSISSFSTFYTPTSQEDISWVREELSGENEEKVDLRQELNKQTCIQTDPEERIKYKDEIKEKDNAEELLVDQMSLCSFHTTVSNFYMDNTHPYEIDYEHKENLSSFCGFTFGLNTTNSCSDTENINLIKSDIKTEEVDKRSVQAEDLVSLSSFYTFYTPGSGMSLDRDSGAEEESGVAGQSLSLTSKCAMRDDVFKEKKDLEYCEDAEIISSFSAFNKLMGQLNQSDAREEGSGLENIDSNIYTFKKEHTDEKTTSEESSQHGNSDQALYIRLYSEENQSDLNYQEDSDDGKKAAAVFCSTTPLLGSPRNSCTGSTLCSADAVANFESTEENDKKTPGKIEQHSESEEEIDMTAFKQLILTNTGDKDVLTDRQNQTDSENEERVVKKYLL